MTSKSLNVAFIHPDLGIGISLDRLHLQIAADFNMQTGASCGAERLVVDAAVGIQKKGHQVIFYTSHHDPNHCFEETRDGKNHM